jgi:hypothetical protein
MNSRRFTASASRASDLKDSTSQYGRTPPHCGISIQPVSQLGRLANVRFTSRSGARADIPEAPLCQELTYSCRIHALQSCSGGASMRESPKVIIATRQGASSPVGGQASQGPEKTSRKSARACPTPFDLRPAWHNGELERRWHAVQGSSRPDQQQCRSRLLLREIVMGQQAGPCLVQLLSPSNEYALALRREEIDVCFFEFAI